jgi:hypothetical protein
MTSMATYVRQGIQDVNGLKGALQLAMQLEFATLPPYLCAEWSADANNDPDQVGNMIGGIALQEMFHFALAGNMLAAIGGSPSVATADFIPKYPTNELPGGIPQKLPVDLKPLSNDQLEVFLQIEFPEFPPVALALAERPATIGAFYDTIATGFQVVNPPIIANPPEVRLGEVVRITSVADAQAAISQIKGEGEGTQGSPDEPAPQDTTFAHYYTFKEILTGHKLVNHSGKWSFSGSPIRFPSVIYFKPAPSGSNPSAAFSTTLSQLLMQLEECWKTPGVAPDVGLMFQLQSEGKALIGGGIRPEFVWSP